MKKTAVHPPIELTADQKYAIKIEMIKHEIARIKENALEFIEKGKAALKYSNDYKFQIPEIYAQQVTLEVLNKMELAAERGVGFVSFAIQFRENTIKELLDGRFVYSSTCAISNALQEIEYERKGSLAKTFFDMVQAIQEND